MGDRLLSDIVAAAAQAPSVHNTRPWRFVADGDHLDVHADLDRRLPVLDPSGRQLHLSCGAAVELGYLVARAADRECTVTLLPDPQDATLLARIAVGGDRAATSQEQALAATIPRRHTDRGAYADDPTPPEVVDDAAARAVELGVWLRRVERPDDRRALIAVLAASEAAEAADPRYAEELRQWTDAEHVSPQWPAGRVSEVPLRDFTGANRHPRPGDDPEAPPPTVERDLLLLIGTEHDDRGSWLAAGRLLGWTLLRATAAGVVAQPLGQAIDLEGGRDRLRHELGLVGHPQFALRLGVKR